MQPVQFGFADPSDAILQGIKTGAYMRQQEQQAAAQQAAQQAAMQRQMDLQRLASNPNATHADYAAVMTRYPDLAENLGKGFKVLEEGQQKNILGFQSRVYAAQLAGNDSLAVELLRERAKADPQQAQHYNVMADLIQKSPATARTISALGLAGAMGPEKFAETFTKLGTEQRAADLHGPAVDKAEADAAAAGSDAVIKAEQARVAPQTADADLAKKEADARAAQSDATIKAEEARVAPQAVLLDLEKKGWDIRKIQEDIAYQKQANRIAAMNAATSRESNALKRRELELKVQEAEQKLAGELREKVATAEAGAANIDNMLNTIERILANKSLDDVVGSLEGRMPAAVGSALDDEEADAIALIETLGSQAFLAQIPNIKGMGQLSNAEGEKLQSALQNLSRAQSEKQFRANLNEAARLLKKGRANIARSTGIPLPKPDTPAAPGSRPPLSSFEMR